MDISICASQTLYLEIQIFKGDEVRHGHYLRKEEIHHVIVLKTHTHSQYILLEGFKNIIGFSHNFSRIFVFTTLSKATTKINVEVLFSCCLRHFTKDPHLFICFVYFLYLLYLPVCRLLENRTLFLYFLSVSYMLRTFWADSRCSINFY